MCGKGPQWNPVGSCPPIAIKLRSPYCFYASWTCKFMLTRRPYTIPTSDLWCDSGQLPIEFHWGPFHGLYQKCPRTIYYTMPAHGLSCTLLKCHESLIAVSKIREASQEKPKKLGISYRERGNKLSALQCFVMICHLVGLSGYEQCYAETPSKGFTPLHTKKGLAGSGHFWLGYIKMLGHLQLSAHLFVCRKYSRVSRYSRNWWIFPAREYFLFYSNSVFHLFWFYNDKGFFAYFTTMRLI